MFQLSSSVGTQELSSDSETEWKQIIITCFSTYFSLQLSASNYFINNKNFDKHYWWFWILTFGWKQFHQLIANVFTDLVTSSFRLWWRYKIKLEPSDQHSHSGLLSVKFSCYCISCRFCTSSCPVLFTSVQENNKKKMANIDYNYFISPHASRRRPALTRELSKFFYCYHYLLNAPAQTSTKKLG